MLKTRVVTALVIAVVGLSALFMLPPAAFALLAGLLLPGLGGWEGARLAGIAHPVARVTYAMVLVIAAALLYYFAPTLTLSWLLAAGCLLWLGNLAWLALPELGRSGSMGAVAAKLGSVTIVLLAAWLSLTWLQAVSPWYVIMLLILIASADTFAYFTGRHFGGPKLAPRISPGKTRSGAVGGLIGATGLTALAATLLPVSPFTVPTTALLALTLALISIGGDLFISLLKRQRELKDTSGLLPGHGGILDRFDSLAAALPFFALAVMLWGQ